MELTPEKRLSIKAVFDKWNDPNHSEDVTLPFDWRSKALKALKEGDVVGMRNEALPGLQYEMLRIAHEGTSRDAIRLQAATQIMAQAGHGAVQRVEASINVKQIPTDQLQAMLASKLANLARLSGMDANVLLESLKSQLPGSSPLPPPVDAEFVEVTEQSNG